MLKNHPLAPPDLYVIPPKLPCDIQSTFGFSLTNSLQGITWRLGYGIDDPNTPEGKVLSYAFFLMISNTSEIRMAKPSSRH